MDAVRLTRDLVRNGSTSFAIRSQVRAGTLHRLRRGAYVDQEVDDPTLAHRRLIEATLAGTHPGAVLSHGSAAVLHGLPAPSHALQRVHLTRDRAGGGQRRGWVQVHGHRLDPIDVWRVDGRPATAPARTVLDLACTLPLHDAVAVGDAALRQGTDVGDLLAAMERMGSRRGIATARRTVELLDPASESYGESVSRVVLVEHDVRAPVPQVVVLDRRGRFVARVDFAWPGLGVVGEFDGRVKYGRELEPDQDPGETLWDEKTREDALRALGWLVVRWTWADLRDPRAWMARLELALASADTRPEPAGSWTRSARSW